MTFSMPQLELAPGRIICLHIPHGFRNKALNAGDTEALVFEETIVRFASHEGKTAAFCRMAMHRRGILDLVRRQTAKGWLSHAAGISQKESARIISDIDYPVADDLFSNAANPLLLLGIAATLVRMPDVLGYSTTGADPSGCIIIHNYVSLKCKDICILYMSRPTTFGDGSPGPRLCPAGAQCVPLAEESKRSDWIG